MTRGFPSLRRIVLGLLAIGALSAFGLGAAVLIVGLKLSSPAPASVGPPPPGLSGAETVEIPSASGSVLHGWWAPAASLGGGAVVLWHGVWENRLRMVPRARVLHQHDFAVLLIDLQAHGESPGRRITFGRLEGLDAAAAVAFVRSRVPAERVGAIGVSLGGAATLLGPARLPVDALVMESVYPDIDAALANRLRTGLGRVAGSLLTPVLAPVFKLLLPPILGVTPSELRPNDRIGSAGTPILVASGTIDDRTPLNEAQALFDHALNPKRFWAVEGVAHVDLERYNPDQYWAEILPFLTQNLHR